uniref:Uncharacterized protein n=1 Tax=Anguilla anguilla TaxID=7936 RepID=A0A0E9T7U7_ANGAN
MQKNSSHETS